MLSPMAQETAAGRLESFERLHDLIEGDLGTWPGQREPAVFSPNRLQNPGPAIMR